MIEGKDFRDYFIINSAGKKFKVFGLWFLKKNIKHFGNIGGFNTKSPYNKTSLEIWNQGYNMKSNRQWGKFKIINSDGGIILDYNNPDNSWLVRGLKDFIPGPYPLDGSVPIIMEGIAYWHGIRIGRFWMLEVRE